MSEWLVVIKRREGGTISRRVFVHYPPDHPIHPADHELMCFVRAGQYEDFHHMLGCIVRNEL